MPLVQNPTQSSLQVLGWTWRIVRIPIVTLLGLVEPVVSFVFGALALLGVLMTLFFKLIHLPAFPAWTMLAISVSFGLVGRMYRGLIKLLDR